MRILQAQVLQYQLELVRPDNRFCSSARHTRKHANTHGPNGATTGRAPGGCDTNLDVVDPGMGIQLTNSVHDEDSIKFREAEAGVDAVALAQQQPEGASADAGGGIIFRILEHQLSEKVCML